MPQHIAIVMDGNGRWAKKRFLPRVAGHVKGVEAIRRTIEGCIVRNIPYLTVFAFSSENWKRPGEEVSFLMNLFLSSLEKETDKLHDNDIRLKVVGDLSRFDVPLQKAITVAEEKTSKNSTLTLTVCANYGGRWDILQAARRMSSEGLDVKDMTEERLSSYLALSYAPEPDLFIRTGGETRISNFLLWQLAYSELYFTETFWPDFDNEELEKAIASFQSRERRFGKTSEQLTD
ncbi:polyprenyl diphosphate synthase [Oxalobacter formigenes]|nr:polyprenyl diphosphate synthase [Oxalobacter formigenes]MCZ4062587.1 polyprenyl diphosphate synthase [Oxalobacter formigenes]QDX32614.1 di-trans,poly-cis-decaprenylcistransferase [Oxalobacter formigenes]WAW01238.1 polyprenyl diphosphate synthase [Oxalobacter formigenes]WAW03567.1 polyprenyl diphosphate synthase [Oxalobacter formigenes]WAW06017.1 polyprenyl diphosphate synthase [Oxalobacter formigenes]